MQRYLSVAKIRRLENRAKEIGLSERLLIENASSNLFQVINSLALGERAVVIAGRGNNGADVLSCARKMSNRGYKINVVILKEKDLNEEVCFQKTILGKMGVSVQIIEPVNINNLSRYFEGCDFILEGILGIGLKGVVSPFLSAAIALINKSKKKLVSCDVPSGLSAGNGCVLSEAIKADYTITFLAHKLGFLSPQGMELCGKIFVVDIGISRQALEK